MPSIKTLFLFTLAFFSPILQGCGKATRITDTDTAYMPIAHKGEVTGQYLRISPWIGFIENDYSWTITEKSKNSYFEKKILVSSIIDEIKTKFYQSSKSGSISRLRSFIQSSDLCDYNITIVAIDPLIVLIERQTMKIYFSIDAMRCGRVRDAVSDGIVDEIRSAKWKPWFGCGVRFTNAIQFTGDFVVWNASEKDESYRLDGSSKRNLLEWSSGLLMNASLQDGVVTLTFNK